MKYLHIPKEYIKMINAFILKRAPLLNATPLH